MSTNPIQGPGAFRPEIPGATGRKQPTQDVADAFGDALSSAITEVDRLQKGSEAAQGAFAAGEDVELHDVLIRIEEAEIAFKTMMEVRNKLISAYQEVMRMGSGG